MSRTFVDVAVVRIGQYVTQIPKLKGIRGSSRMISTATDEDSVVSQLARTGVSGVIPNPDIGRADGVVHLEVQPDASISAEATARAVLTQLRRDLVGAQLSASWAIGDDYTAARQIMDRGRGPDSLEWLPAPSEVPFLAPCTKCALRPASSSGAEGLCQDCQRREDQGRLERQDDSNARTFVGAELESLTTKNTGTPSDNHIALLTADGNGVGALFESLIAHSEVSAEQRRSVSLGLTSAAERAFTVATDTVRQPDEPARIVPLLRGGDDLSVFLAADLAWEFTLSLLNEFQARTRELLQDTFGALAGDFPVPTMSAGLIFSKVKFPASQAFVAAEQLMRRAKSIGSEHGAAVAWRDVTTHGIPTESGAGSGRTAMPLTALEEMSGALAALAQAKPSALKGLASRLGEWAELGMAEQSDELLRIQARRVGMADLLAPFIDSRISVADAIDLTRWWPTDA